MLLWAPRCTHGPDLGHIWSEITSRKQDDFAGVSRQSRLRRRVCQHFPFASAAVQKDTKIESGHVCQVIVVSIHFFFSFSPPSPLSFSSVAVFTVWSAVIRVVGVDSTDTEASFTQSLFSWVTFVAWYEQDEIGGDNSVALFRCDSESFKGSVCHIWDFEEETV